MIIVDTSAVIAISQKEETASDRVARLGEERVGDRRMSAASFLEAGTVMAGRTRIPLRAIRELDGLLEDMGVELADVDAEQARIALEARIRYGRGFGTQAKLNFGDCFSYALAKILNAPLLYVGDDFDKTDVKSALPRKRRK